MKDRLRDYERPLYSNTTINAEIEKIRAANGRNNTALAQKKSELKQFSNIHSYLRYLQREHEPPPPERQPQQRKRNEPSL